MAEDLREAEFQRCRFYENRYPVQDEVIMVQVVKITEIGVYVTLLEYGGIEGMILLGELSRKRIRSMNNLVRVNRNEVVTVLRVDEEKGYTDLSKRRVSPEDIVKCEDRYNKAKHVHSVLSYIAAKRNMPLESLYSTVGWPLYRKYGHAYHSFKLSVSIDCMSEDIFAGIAGIPQDLRQDILANVARRFTPQPIRIRADIDVSCSSSNGIESIRDALLAGKAVVPRNARAMHNSVVTYPTQVSIRLIAPPTFVMATVSFDREEGIAYIDECIEEITRVIVERGGTIKIKSSPKAVSQRDESDLKALLDRLAIENEDVDGDGPEDT